MLCGSKPMSVTQVQKRNPDRATDKKRRTLRWHLPVGNKQEEVCKGFFLTTFGRKPNYDEAVSTALNTDRGAKEDGRGRQPATNRIDPEILQQHIESYRPCRPHYRYIHAPLCRYLPSEICIADMYRDFREKYEDLKVGYERYRREVQKMNVGFTVLGHEECEICKRHSIP